MSRIVVAECKQEVASFNPVPSRYEDFAVRRGHDFFEYHAAAREEVGGALQVLGERQQGHPVPAYSATSYTSGGTLAGPDFRRIAGEFAEALEDAGPVDGAYFALHGAMSAEGEHDPEGYLLELGRTILGEDIPIVVSLDLHGILTERMLRQCDAVVAFHTYPHVDFFETGARAARVLTGILTGRVRPVTARVRIPVLVRGDELVTETGSFGRTLGHAVAFERSRAGLSAGVMIGNPFTDVPSLRSNAFAVADGDPALASRCALRLAERMWDRRKIMQAKLTGLREAVRVAAGTQGTTVLMDAADATSSGATGDGNAILRELRRSAFPGTVLAPIVDPGAVERAFVAGVGQTIRTVIGGALDPQRFRPMRIRGRVRMLSDGELVSESFGCRWKAGRTAVLEWNRCVLVVTSRPVNLFDRALFLAHGQDPRAFDLVVVKSPHCEPHMYRDWCARLVQVDAPGATSANLVSLGHSRCARPVYPLDPEVDFVPTVSLHQRDRYR